MRHKNPTKNDDELVMVAKAFGIFRCDNDTDIALHYMMSYMMMHMHGANMCMYAQA